MYTLLEDFFEKQHIKNTLFLDILKKFPPLESCLEENLLFLNEFSEHLKSAENRHLLTTMFELVQNYISSLETRSFDLATKFKFWGHLHQSDKIRLEQTITLNALLFQHAHIGNTFTRTCYAALKMYEALSPLAAKIYIKSIASHNHTAVYIKLEKQWWIYDPNLNPNLIFTNQEYRHLVVRQLPKHTNHAVEKINWQIKPETWILFQKQLPKMQDILKNFLLKRQSAQFYKDSANKKIVGESIDKLNAEISIQIR
jgi:hypothetical protein